MTGDSEGSTTQSSPPSGAGTEQRGAWAKYQDRQKRKAVEKAHTLKRRRDIDKKRRFITYPVYIAFMGLIIVALIYTVYYPLKHKYYGRSIAEEDVADFVMETGRAADEGSGWDEETGGKLPVNLLSSDERTAMEAKVDGFKRGLSTLEVGVKSSILKASRGVFEGLSSGSVAAEKYMGHFGMGMIAVVEGASTSEGESGGIGAASHFTEVMKLSKLKNVTETFEQINLNTTYNSLALDAAFKFSDILRVCHHRNCQGMGMKRDEMLAQAQEALREAKERIPFTGREGDVLEFLRKFHEVSYMMGDYGSALSALEEEIDIEVTKLPKTWQFEERVVRPDTDHVAKLFTQLCALNFELQRVKHARESCGKAMEYSELGINVESFLFAAEVERATGNMSFAAKFYERALSAQTLKEASKVQEEEGWNGTSVLLIADRLGGVLTRVGKHSEAEEYYKLAVGAEIKGGSELRVTGEGPMVQLARQFLGTQREDGATHLFETAMRLNEEKKLEAPEAGWRFGLGLASAAGGGYKDAHDHFSHAMKLAREGSNAEFKSLVTAFHALPSCPVVDSRVTDLSLLINGLRKAKKTSAMSKSYFVPEDFYQMRRREEKEEWDGQTWTVRSKWAKGYYFLAKSWEEVKEKVGDKDQMAKKHFVASKSIDGVIARGTCYALVSGSWPLARVYVHAESTTVKGWNGTFSEWIDDTVRGIEDEAMALEEIELKVGDDVLFGEEKEDLFQKVRRRNIDEFWRTNKENVGKIFESSFNYEVGKWLEKEKKGDVKVEDRWRKYATDTKMCREKVVYAVDFVVYDDKEAAVESGGEGLGVMMNKPKTVVESVERVVNADALWDDEVKREGVERRVEEAMMIMNGGVIDRGALDMIKGKYLTPDKLGGGKMLSQRLSWSIQELTRWVCPDLYEEKVARNRRGDDGGGSKEEMEEFGCDQDKLGFLAVELTIATLEWERRRGWDLVSGGVAETPSKEKAEEWKDEWLREGSVMNYIFSKWVAQKQKEERKKEGKRKGRGEKRDLY